MVSGGARARSGPPPDPAALRRDRKSDGEWTTLPTAGRAGDPPAWPLTGASGRESELWARLWAMPQAVAWEAARQDVEVALYVRNLAKAERPKAAVNLGTLVRQQADALGLTLPGLRVNRWRIGDVKAPAAEQAVERGPSARARFRVVDGGA